MHHPFDNPEIAAASHQRRGAGWVGEARPAPAAPATPQRPVPSGRGVSVSGAAPLPRIVQAAPVDFAATLRKGCVYPGGASRRSPRAVRPTRRAAHC